MLKKLILLMVLATGLHAAATPTPGDITNWGVTGQQVRCVNCPGVVGGPTFTPLPTVTPGGVPVIFSTPNPKVQPADNAANPVYQAITTPTVTPDKEDTSTDRFDKQGTNSQTYNTKNSLELQCNTYVSPGYLSPTTGAFYYLSPTGKGTLTINNVGTGSGTIYYLFTNSNSSPGTLSAIGKPCPTGVCVINQTGTYFWYANANTLTVTGAVADVLVPYLPGTTYSQTGPFN